VDCSESRFWRTDDERTIPDITHILLDEITREHLFGDVVTLFSPNYRLVKFTGRRWPRLLSDIASSASEIFGSKFPASAEIADNASSRAGARRVRAATRRRQH
jgi:ATP:corrinoid adenosyltransferase